MTRLRLELRSALRPHDGSVGGTPSTGEWGPVPPPQREGKRPCAPSAFRGRAGLGDSSRARLRGLEEPRGCLRGSLNRSGGDSADQWDKAER